jgi:hypothetical protein
MAIWRLLNSETRMYIKIQNKLQRRILCLTFRSNTANDKIFKVINLNIHFHTISNKFTLYKNREESLKKNYLTTIFSVEKCLY